ncbi:hypothetical protein [Arcicella aurantiaca]|nr:hypothetical protein [Arcicella aurantiaca]
MKKTLQRLGMVAVGLSLCLWSCDKQDGLVQPAEVQETQIINKGVTAEKGRISFESIDAFKATIEELKMMTEKERVNWDKKIGFESMQEFYDSHSDGVIFKENNPIFKTDKVDKVYIPDMTFSHILNSDGVVKIGKEVYKFTPDGNRLTVKSENENLLADGVKDSRVVQEKIVVKLTGEINKEQSKNARPNTDFPITGRSFDGDHAVIAVFSETQWFIFYTSWSMKLMMREYRQWWWFIYTWQSGTAQNLELSNASVYFNNWAQGNFGGVGSNSCNDCEETSVYLGGLWGPTIGSTDFVIHANCKAKWNNQDINFSF